MESFDNFQYDSASTYGGLPIVDDTSSMISGYTTNTQNRLPSDIESLSNLSLSLSTDNISSNGISDSLTQKDIVRASAIEDEDLDGVLDDLKTDGGVELPPYACR